MATFDEAQVTAISRIFSADSDEMDAHLTYRASLITDADKAAVIADIAAHVAIEDDNVNVTAGPAGFQGRISPAEKRSLIKQRIAGLIKWPYYGGSRLVRS